MKKFILTTFSLLFLPVAASAMQVDVGTYTGNATDNRAIIGIGFKPDFVLVDAAGFTSGASSVMKTTTMSGSSSKEVSTVEVLNEDSIESFDADGFTIGTDANVNNSGTTYHYTAIKSNEADFVYGTYTGDGVNGRRLQGLSFSPDVVIVLPEGASYGQYRTRGHAANFSGEFTSGTGGDFIENWADSGFQLSSDGAANSSTEVYHYVAFRTSSVSNNGTYTGNGVDNREITGVGFTPDMVFVHRSSGFQDVSHWKPNTISASSSMPFVEESGAVNAIYELTADGFVVGTDGSVNCNGCGTYGWFALQEGTSDAEINEANVQQRLVIFTSTGTFLTPSSTTAVDGETWGAGGGGTWASGSGGGGAYAARTTIPVDAGDSYPIVVGTSNGNANGASSTFAAGSSTIEIIAEGGLSGGNGGTGGTAASSTGATKFSGGNGTVSGSNVAGGGSAGDSANGSGSNGGAVNGASGAGVSNLGADQPGAGGGTQSGAGHAGARGEARITYNQGTPDNYAYITARSYNRATADGTSHSITMPSGIVSGDLLIAVFSSDGTGTSSPSAGWTELLDAQSDANNGEVFYKTAVGSDTLTVTTSALEGSSHVVFLIKNGGTPTASVASSTAAADANPPSHDAGSSVKYLWITTVGWDFGLVGLDVSTVPAGYTDYINVPGFDPSDGVQTAVSNRYAEKQTEDPGVWTSGSESWVSFTIAVPFDAGAAEAAVGSGSSGSQTY